jgi:hypothetical protein
MGKARNSPLDSFSTETCPLRLHRLGRPAPSERRVLLCSDPEEIRVAQTQFSQIPWEIDPEVFLKKVQEQGLFDNLADAHSNYSSDSSTHTATVRLYFKRGVRH